MKRWQALSIIQPWPFAIFFCGKNVENRSWYTDFRGDVLIHASKGLVARTCAEELKWISTICPGVYDLWPGREEIPRGGIVGKVKIVDCRFNDPTKPQKSPWEIPGKYSFVLENAKPLPFIPCSGRLQFWDVPEDVVDQLRPSLEAA